jgi:hypothetical protein
VGSALMAVAVDAISSRHVEITRSMVAGFRSNV